MSDNVLETIRATVQDFLAPELRTHGIKLEHLERRLDDGVKNLEHRLDDTKETLRAETRALEARMDARLGVIEALIRQMGQQMASDTALRESVASLEARMPKQ